MTRGTGTSGFVRFAWAAMLFCARSAHAASGLHQATVDSVPEMLAAFGVLRGMVLVLGVVTAVGGGTIRDMALANGPVFWVKDPTDLVVAMVTCLLTIVLVRQPRRLPKWILPVLDAVGLAVFVGIGVNKAFNAGTGPMVAICMGVLTGVGGGIIRDILAREVPMILRTEIYATACIVGGIVHATAYYTFALPLENAAMLGMVVTLVIRLAAIRWHLKLPTFALDDNGR